MTHIAEHLQELTALSHEFGTPDYVRGGGGNSSCKDTASLWIKPSGRTLAEMTPDSFVKLHRTGIQRLFHEAPPPDPQQRENWVKDVLGAAVKADSTPGRPSVETALHEAFHAVFVLHTHPALVNGMTCAADGENVCARLFPDALWIPYVNPGYTLSTEARRLLTQYEDEHGSQPELVFVQNHGLFVAADAPERMRECHNHAMDTLKQAYAERSANTELEIAHCPSSEKRNRIHCLLQETIGPESAAHVAVQGFFTPPGGPLTPDHIVYAGSYALEAEPTAEAVQTFRERHGYPPRIIVTADGVYATGATRTQAELALALAEDGALVEQLCGAFGGAAYLSTEHRAFIESWEVEKYRQQIAADSG